MDELREMMEAAYAAEEEKMANTDKVQDPTPEEPTETPTEETPPEETPSEPEKLDADKQEPTPSNKDRNLPSDSGDPQSVDQPANKVPASWSAKARETWGKLPADAQAEIVKRESEINRVLQESASARRTLGELNAVMQPHVQRMMASGVQSPIQAIGQLLATEQQLSGGDVATKAHTIAQLINRFGVDINTLDQILSNSPSHSHPTPQNPNIDQMLNERLAPFQNFMQQQQQYMQFEQSRKQQEANQSVQTFAQNAEFLSDVRLDMADLMDLAASRGKEMSLQEAYDKACAMNPDVSAILAQRQKQAQLVSANQAAAAKRNASVSLTGQQNGSAKTTGDSLRDAIANAWSESMG